MLRKLILNKFWAKIFIKLLVRLNSATYRWISRFAIVLNDGLHPKHSIIDYADWFKNHIDSSQTVLDIGSNNGQLTSQLALKAGFVYGIELSAELAKEAIAKNSADNIEYICADATDFDCSAIRPIDCIVLSNVLEHIENRIGFLKKIIKQISQKSAKDLKILIRVPALDRDWLVEYKKSLGLDWRLDKTHFIEYTNETLNAELGAVGMEVIESQRFFGEIYAVCKPK